ncbi:hypothetical protein, partial [uncultured Kingella sp.]|uniref:hypothetical protein n=1 Tax=uncultured Kingella sp. TaxID=159270 RepID=UPI002592B8DC
MLAKRPVTQVSTHNRPKAAAPRATTPQSDALQFNPLLATRPRRSIPRPSHQHFQAAAQIARNRKGSLKNECTRFSGCLYITPPNKHRQPANQSQYSAPFKHAFWQWAMSRRRSMPCQPQHRFQAAYFFLSLAFAGGLLLGFAADLSPAWGLAFSGCLLLGLAFSGCLTGWAASFAVDLTAGLATGLTAGLTGLALGNAMRGSCLASLRFSGFSGAASVAWAMGLRTALGLGLAGVGCAAAGC